MVRTRLKGINTVRKTLADGSVRKYYYHRASGRKLPGLPGEPEFIAAYAAACASATGHVHGTLNSLIHKWTLSPRWTEQPPPNGSGYAESTRREYRRMLANIEAEFGAMPIAALDDARVRQDFLKWRLRVAKSNGAREADNRLSVLSALLSWARDGAGEIAHNHIAGFERLYHVNRADRIWLPDQIERFLKSAPVEMQRAMIMALHTGQRQGDLLRLTWGNYEGGWIKLRQGKSGFKTKVEIPCTPTLRSMLDGMDRRSAVILTTKTGQPWKARYFKRQWEAVCQSVNIEGLHFHDLRGTAVTMLAEAGATTPQIASITGHSLRTVTYILDRYLARTRHLAEGAMNLFQNAKATEFANRLQTDPEWPKKQKLNN